MGLCGAHVGYELGITSSLAANVICDTDELVAVQVFAKLVD